MRPVAQLNQERLRVQNIPIKTRTRSELNGVPDPKQSITRIFLILN